MDIDDDLFDAFGQSTSSETLTKTEAKPTQTGSGPSAKELAEQLLRSLAEGQTDFGQSAKRSADSAEILEEEDVDKRPKLDETEEDVEELGTLESMPRIKIHTLDSPPGCTHEVAVPDDFDYQPIKPAKEMAKSYPFTLDSFQTEALMCLDSSQSVLVSAHTSAGKTVVALYAIAMSLRDKQRVIYTSPIKALSNQKYRELYEEFSDVGLMTGDVTINPSASCIVMTTEILRSMLYRGSEIMREVGWVIFDEIHYMRDKERGVVWEETIILLPDSVHYVFLSATIPNARQFAEWICYLHKQPCHVVYTDYRPVPLQHYIYPAGGDGIHLVVNENGQFREENFDKAMSVLRDAGDAGKGDQRGRRGGVVGESSLFKLVKMIMEKDLAPAIVFSFSRKETEANALQMARLDFTTEDQKKLIMEIFNNAIDVLSDDDRKLPQVENVLPLLKRGIGMHHSGLLPILKETIEILFGEGLLKVLFATETFAMGLNMPAKTVLFTTARKYDGKVFRWLSSGEYIQMSGRAGRRGLDERGTVILMIDQYMNTDVAKTIVKGLPDPLNSQFRLTYNMVLNLLRVEEINPEYMLERSFFQFQNYAQLPGLFKKVKTLEDKWKNTVVPRELEVSGYYKIKQQMAQFGKEVQKIMVKPIYIVPFLQPGRLVRIVNKQDDFGWGLVINFKKQVNKEDPMNNDPVYVVDILLHLAKECAGTKNTGALKPCVIGETGQMEVVPVVLDLISQISTVRVKYPEDLRPLDNRMSVLKTIQEVHKRFPNGFPLLDPVEDMKIKEPSLKEIVKKIQSLETRLYSHPLEKDPKMKELVLDYEKKLSVENDLKAAKLELKKARSLLQLDDLKKRKRVLRRLGYADAQDVITVKGRVACEISAADELLLTEMIFNGLFNELSPQKCVALLSCFVFEEKAEMPKLADELSGILRQMQEMARQIAVVSIEAKLTLDEEEYVESFKPNLMDIVFAWSNGCTFSELCKMTDIFEGSIIRAMRRLEELIREMCSAAKAIGNSDLEKKFAEDMISSAAKNLLKNCVIHTEAHNKHVEEREMWKEWEKEGSGSAESQPSRRRHDPYRREKRSEYPRSGFEATRQLDELERSIPDRWTHDGYKELYPEQFNPKMKPEEAIPEQTDSTDKRKKHKRKKRRRSTSSTPSSSSGARKAEKGRKRKRHRTSGRRS